MKNVFLSVVIICALAIAGVGGTLAGFSDTEESVDNYIITGSLDLKVDGNDDLPYGTGVDTIVMVEDIMPCKWYEYDIPVRNDGQAKNPDGSDEVAYLYIHFKNISCDNVEPKHDGYDLRNYAGLYDELTNKDITSFIKPEPELVAEFGGVVEQTWVDGTGQTGDECCLATHIEMQVYYRGDLIKCGKMGTFECEQLYLGELPPCGETHNITLKFHLQQIEDGYWEGDPKFKDWPTNALMTDKISFDILFELLQEPVE